jgi:hypothetical protein
LKPPAWQGVAVRGCLRKDRRQAGGSRSRRGRSHARRAPGAPTKFTDARRSRRNPLLKPRLLTGCKRQGVIRSRSIDIIAHWDRGPWANSSKTGFCRTVAESNLRQGSQMASQLEFSARAALCRLLAKREPTNRVLWTAEAENWSRLSNEKLRGEPKQNSVTASGNEGRIS